MQRDQYLKTLCGLGFTINAVLAEGLDAGLATGSNHFDLPYEGTFDDNKIGAKIHFSKKMDLDEYAIFKYEAWTRESSYPFEERKNGFVLNHGMGVTLKEAYNLLQGRPILRDFITTSRVPFCAWMELDFTERDISGNYREVKYSAKNGFDLERVVRMYPIKDLEDENDTHNLIWSLQRGDRIGVTFQKKRKVEKVFIEVNIKTKGLKLIPWKVIDDMKKGEEKLGHRDYDTED
jgi:hypothetical protein